MLSMPMAESTAVAGPWSSLPIPLTPWILDVVQSMGYSQMTPVQAATIPLLMQHRDVIVEAVTGSGKTLAFVIPILERLVRREATLKTNEISVLVISPTRELATQLHSVFSSFTSAQPRPSHLDESTDASTSVPVYPPPLLLVSSDESSPAQDVRRFLDTRADIVIGTPGRVEEFLLGRGKTIVSARELDVLILDEADRLLDLGFQSTLTRIITHLPKQRRTGLFSATMTDADALSELVRAGLRNPTRVVVKVQSKKTKKRISDGKPGRGEVIEERRIPAGLENFYVNCRPSEKLVQLVRIIEHEVLMHGASHFIVYFATCACVDYFYRVLPGFLLPGSTFFSLHGHLLPAARTRALSAFSSSLPPPGSSSVLLATDVAARGLDIPHVDIVIQFDPPIDPKAFSHRCGRTARAGRSGRAYVLLVGREVEYVDFLAVRKIPIRQYPLIRDSSTSPEQGSSHLEPDGRTVASFLSQIRKIVLTDRALSDKATKSFVSFVRAYSKHEASYIFRIKDLDLVGVAKSFGLLRLPRMPELKDVDRTEWEDAPLDWDAYRYADKAKEVKRRGQVKPQAQKETTETRAAKRKRNTSWSQQASIKEQKEKRRLKKDRKRRWLKSQACANHSLTVPQLIEGGRDGDDWDELAREERLTKRERKGTVLQQAFDAGFSDL